MKSCTRCSASPAREISMQNAIEVNGLTKLYGGFSLDNVSFTLPTGCIMGLIGENGAGKSTTIRLLLGLAKRTSGEVRVLGADPETAEPELREEIGAVFDDCPFPETMSLRDVRKILSAAYRHFDGGRFDALALKFGLPEKQKIKEYSRGMRMKLSISAALSHGARLLILDEPTSGLDPVARDELLDILLDYIQDERCSVLISSHILSDLEKACDYITFIHTGRVVFSEEKDELLEKYVIAKGSEREIAALDPEAVVGVRRGAFGSEALVKRAAGEHLTHERASIEDIMLYYIKGDAK